MSVEDSDNHSIVRTGVQGAPPSGSEITLIWAQLQQSSKKSPIKVFTDSVSKLVSVDTVRQMQSAASQWSAYSLLREHPGCLLEDSNNKLAVQPCRFANFLESTLFHRGMSTRLGSDVRPSRPLLRRHLVWLEASLDQRYRFDSTPAEKREFAKAGLDLLLLCLGFFQSWVTQDGLRISTATVLSVPVLLALCIECI